jgi:hypothetical protein
MNPIFGDFGFTFALGFVPELIAVMILVSAGWRTMNVIVPPLDYDDMN